MRTSAPCNNTPYNICRLDLWVDPVFDELVSASGVASLTVLPSRGDDARTLAGLRSAHAYHVSAAKDELPRPWFVSRELIRECPGLLCMSSSGAGFDTIDVEACTEAGIAVVNQAGMNAYSVAEMTFALLLALERRVVLSHNRLRTENGFTRESLMGHEIRGKRIGLIGIGQIGRRVAEIAKGFGMHVMAFDPLLDAETIRARGAEPADFETLLKQADIVSLHCPLDARTRGMFGAAQYAAMKPGALFLTTARGGIHDEDALHAALVSGHLGGAGLDVWLREPPGNDAPLLQLPNVVATFHTGGVTHEARRSVARGSAEQLLMMLRGERPPRLVNPEVWERAAARIAKLA
ncbi:3-phosphoglycerate dehydrogenase [Bordetella genomosp. 9]|uniref:hydroxyacid dehydrogenase n=1 Tax=Bordetella genomosp. 9 TaxID=1416803 RepID=UPI000A292DF9|nr:hydroxyacid dehydrogenase [Bordetella genomosp. 9]ARP90693.1 3-phosphoglycerate dehydrogenase [Bordetella genomosp. 9]